MAETKVISVSKPRRSFTERKVSFEKVGGKQVLRVELVKVQKPVECWDCKKQISAGSLHTTAMVAFIDREKKISQTRHIPRHYPTCPKH